MTKSSSYIREDTRYKLLRSPAYNFNFDKSNGYFERWGKGIEDDPTFSPFGPEILDLEVSVDGCSMGCEFCYKNNSNQPPTNMSLDKFKDILGHMPKTLTQIAFGLTDIKSNPDFIEMMKHSRESGVIPNFTISGIDLDDDMAEKCSELAGAIAVSVYQKDKNICYNAVKKLTDLGMDQVNIHFVLAKESLPFAEEVIRDIKEDDRLEKLNAIVFLGIKPKGRSQWTPVDDQEFAKIIELCNDNKVNIGFDSCSAPKYERHVRGNYEGDQRERMLSFSEPCESGLFSAYINVEGKYFPCSFMEGEGGWEDGIPVDRPFVEIWNEDKSQEWKEKLLKCKRNCPTFRV